MIAPGGDVRRHGGRTLMKRVRIFFRAAGVCLFLFHASASAGETKPADYDPDQGGQFKATGHEDGPSRVAGDDGSRWSPLLSPATDLFPRAVADPRRSGLAFTYNHFTRSGNVAAGDDRVTIRLGGSYGLIRVHPEGEPERGYQLDIGANFLGRFDLDHSLDNIGWDGLYHFSAAWGDGRGLAVKFGTFHDSSHVGDEYAERTGRKRIGYTREEVALGVSDTFARHWRLYGEAGRAYHLSNKALMEPWRAQAGLEYQSPLLFGQGSMGWYAATDCSFFEEDDWRANAGLQLGVVLPRDDIGRRYRFGIEYYSGRSIIGEFFQDRESYLAAGIWWDL